MEVRTGRPIHVRTSDGGCSLVWVTAIVTVAHDGKGVTLRLLDDDPIPCEERT